MSEQSERWPRDTNANAAMGRLLGIPAGEIGTMLTELQLCGRNAYWAALNEAIARGLMAAKVWNGEEKTRERALDFVAGRVALRIDPASGSVEVAMLGKIVAKVGPPVLRVAEKDPKQKVALQ